MPVGPLVSTYTLLANTVELQGQIAVSDGSVNEGQPLGALDHFDLLLDDAFSALASAVSGMTPGSETGGDPAPRSVRCAAAAPPPDQSNQPDPGGIPALPADTTLTVKLADGSTRSLNAGDHVRLVGHLWLAHDPALNLRVEDDFKISGMFLALQPFDWTDIQVIPDIPPAPNQVAEGAVAIAAPLFQERYLVDWPGNGTPETGTAGHVFLADDGSNYHNSITETVEIQAPSLPAGFTGDASLVTFEEEVLFISSGLAASSVRSVFTTAHSIQVSTTLVPFVGLEVAGLPIADPNLPQAFAARYHVRWDSRLIAQDRLDMTGFTNKSSTSSFNIINRGPDDLSVQAVIQNDANQAFQVANQGNLVVPKQSAAALAVIFTPPADGLFSAHMKITSDDPVGAEMDVALTGSSVTDPKDIKDNKDNKETKEKAEKDKHEKEDKEKGEKDKHEKENKEHQEKVDREKAVADKDDDKPRHKPETKEMASLKEKDLEHPLRPFNPAVPGGMQFAMDASGSSVLLEPRGRHFIRRDERPTVGDRAFRGPLPARTGRRRGATGPGAADRDAPALGAGQ